MHVLFLGFSVSDALFDRVLETDRGMPIQTQRFGWAVIAALQAAGARVDLVVAEPTADYPNNARAFIGGATFHERETDGKSIAFVNVTGFKHVTRYVAASLSARRIGRTRRPDAILIHGVHSPFLWLGLRLGRRWNIPVISILTDAPSLRTRYDHGVSSAMKAFDRRLILRALRRVDGVVALTPMLADELAPEAPRLLLEGIATASALHPAERPDPSLPVVVYAGGLHNDYGVLDLLQSVQYAKKAWRLRIYGRGPAEGDVRRAAETHDLIEYGGSVSPDAMPGIYSEADLLVNPRPAHTGLAARSFPSKLLEYLASGVPVVTTDLPALPDDYRANLTISAPGALGLAESIDRLVSLSSAERRRLGASSRDFILTTRGVAQQGARLRAFIAGLEH